MSVKIRISITKDILRRSAYCGKAGMEELVMTATTPEEAIAACTWKDLAGNCAFALAVRDIFPDAVVYTSKILPFGPLLKGWNEFSVTAEMRSFIAKFDTSSPIQRMLLGEQDFELDIPDWVVDRSGRDRLHYTHCPVSRTGISRLTLYQ